MNTLSAAPSAVGAAMHDLRDDAFIGHYWFSTLPRTGETIALPGEVWSVVQVEHWPRISHVDEPPPEMRFHVRLVVRLIAGGEAVDSSGVHSSRIRS